MKCTLELYGKTYESTEFTERQVSLFLAASAGATGINIKDLFEDLMGAQDMPVRGLREYNSLESAEKDLALVLKRVFPTLERSIESIDTAELIAIVKPMLFALAGVEESIGQTEALIEEDSLLTKIDESIKDTKFWKNEPLRYPPEIKTLTNAERIAIDYAASQMNVDIALPTCWYQWWQAVNASESETDYNLTPAQLIELISEFSEEPRFDYTFSSRCYALLMANLESSAIEVVAA